MENPIDTPLKTAARSTHPLILVAAASVTLLSFAGIASIAGWLPNTRAEAVSPVAQMTTPPQITQATPAIAPVAAEKAAAQSAPASSRIAAKPVEQRPPQRTASAQRVAMPSAPVNSAKPPPIADWDPNTNPNTNPGSSPNTSHRETTQASTPPVSDNGIYTETSRPPQSQCSDCGTVESVREIAQEGKGSGLGAIAGTLLGGILGHQVGNGTGRDIATVVGALGGAFAGNEVEKNARASHQYQITVRLDDGSMRTITETEQPKWHNGDRVRVNNNRIASL